MTAIAPTRTNRVLDPTAESGIGGAQTSAGAAVYVLSYDTTVFDSGAQSVLCTRTATSPTVNIGVINMTATNHANLTKVPCDPGEVVSASLRVRCGVPGFRARVTLAFRDDANVAQLSVAGTLTLGLPLNTWSTVVVENATAPAGTTFMNVIGTVLGPIGYATTGGEQCWFDSVMCNTGPTVQPFFYGDTPGCRWTGTPHRSTSEQPPWQLWDGSTLSPLTVDGTWDGSAIVPATYVDVSTA